MHISHWRVTLCFCFSLITTWEGSMQGTHLARAHARKLCQWLSFTPIEFRPSAMIQHTYSQKRCPSSVYILVFGVVSQARLLYFPFCVYLVLHTYLSCAKVFSKEHFKLLSVTPIDNRPNTTHIFSGRCPSCVYILCSWSVSQARLLYFPFCAYLVLHTYPSGTKFLVSVRVHTFTYVKTSSTQ